MTSCWTSVGKPCHVVWGSSQTLSCHAYYKTSWKEIGLFSGAGSYVLGAAVMHVLLYSFK
jgi:hypothetical protein